MHMEKAGMDTLKENSYSHHNRLADIYTPLIYNQWYVAGLSTEFTRELKERFILERSIVFYRKDDNTPVALQNRCAHRSFPLHESRLEGNDIRCNYHGIKYNHLGEIVDVPCQEMCPKVKIHSYPLKEIGPFVWIWMGEPGTADDSLLPELEYVHDREKWTVVYGDYNHVEGNYLLMLENLCDLTHLPFLHGKTFSPNPEYAKIPLQVEENENVVEYYRAVKNAWHLKFYNFFYSEQYDFSDIGHEYRHGGRVLSPAMFNGFGVLTPDDGREPLYRYVNHYLTPEYQDSCHYYYYVARNYDLDNERFDSLLLKSITDAFNEDKVATKVMQDIISRDNHSFREMNIAGDKAGMLMRSIIKKYADAEIRN